MKKVLGIDIGTSSAKALIVDESGRMLGSGSKNYSLHFPGKFQVEQDPETWWKAVSQAIGIALQEAKTSGNEISALSFSGQMHGMVAIDRKRRLLGNAIIHLDQRSSGELAEIRALAGDLMRTELLNLPSAGMMLATVYWMKKHMPKRYEALDYVLSPKDYIRMRFCGEIGTEYTDAGATLGFSVKNRVWCSELFRRLGLREDIWPQVYESSAIAGQVTEEAARATGLSQKTVVIYGAGDSMAALTGNGVIEKGVMACNIGTSSQLAVVSDVPIFDPQLRIQTWCHTVKERWVVQSGTLNGGNALRWLRDQIFRDQRPYAELDRAAGTVAPTAEGLVFIPYLVGERTPYDDPMAKGVYFGLSMKHTQEHMVRATMEGILFNLKECLEIMDELQVEHKLLISSGGAARGETWKQIQADMLDMPVHKTVVEEEACLGAAILAFVGIGVFSDVSEACKILVKLSDHVTEPIAANVRLYREKQSLFHELYHRVKDLFPQTK